MPRPKLILTGFVAALLAVGPLATVRADMITTATLNLNFDYKNTYNPANPSQIATSFSQGASDFPTVTLTISADATTSVVTFDAVLNSVITGQNIQFIGLDFAGTLSSSSPALISGFGSNGYVHFTAGTPSIQMDATTGVDVGDFNMMVFTDGGTLPHTLVEWSVTVASGPVLASAFVSPDVPLHQIPSAGDPLINPAVPLAGTAVNAAALVTAAGSDFGWYATTPEPSRRSE